MTEDHEVKPEPFDAEWEIAKHRARFTDILNMIEELKAKDRTLSSRISRLRLASIEEEEGPREEEESSRAQSGLEALENMTLEERAIFISDALDRRQILESKT